MNKILIIVGFIVSFVLGGVTAYLYKDLNINSNDVSAISSVIDTMLTGFLIYIAYKANESWQEQKKYEEKLYILSKLENFYKKFKEQLSLYDGFEDKNYFTFKYTIGDFCKNVVENNLLYDLEDVSNRAKRLCLAVPHLEELNKSVISKLYSYSIIRDSLAEVLKYPDEVKEQELKDPLEQGLIEITNYYSLETKNILKKNSRNFRLL